MMMEGRTLVLSNILFLCKQYSRTCGQKEAVTCLSKRATIVIAHRAERCPFS